MSIRSTLARLLDPGPYAELEEQRQRMRQLEETCGYEFPTVRVVIEWIRNSGGPAAAAVHDYLDHENFGEEPEELAPRLLRSLPLDSRSTDH